MQDLKESLQNKISRSDDIEEKHLKIKKFAKFKKEKELALK